MAIVDDAALAVMFTDARSQNGWRSDPVSDEELKAAYDIAKYGPTSMNTQPMRIVFLRSQEAKDRLAPALSPTNVPKVMAAPVVALIAFDTEFYTQLSRTFAHNPNAPGLFTGNPGLIEPTAFRNSSLQAAYYMLALRAVGLDVGPMSGFDPARVNEIFFSDSKWRINLICGIGHGDSEKVMARLPRLDFEDVTSTI